MSGTQFELDDLFKSYNQKLSNVLPSAVGYNVALYAGASLVTLIVFIFLRPQNKVIFEPKIKYYEGDNRPPKIGNGLFAWISPLMGTHEDELVHRIGLDAVAFLRFLRLMRWLFTIVAVLCCAVLIPVDVVYNANHIVKDGRNILSTLTIQNVDGWFLWLHVGMSYAITFVVCGMVWWHWRKMVQLRNVWFRSDEYGKSFYARTLMITDVPKPLRDDNGLRSIFESIKMPYPTTAVQIGRRVGQLPELVEYHNNTVRELETVLVRYLKGGKVASSRPTITQGGCLGVGGEKKDAIDFYTTKLEKTETAVENWRTKMETNKEEPYGFASMAAVPYAHIVARLLNGKHPRGTTITLAPNPKDIIWSNLAKGEVILASNRTTGWLLLAAVCFFNTIPLLIISLLANLTALSQFWPLLNKWLQADEFSFTLVSGILPPTVSALFGYVLPLIMRRLFKYMGALTRSQLDRAVVARLFAFLIISQFFIFSLIGVLFNASARVATQIVNKEPPSVIWNQLAKLPGSIQSTYLEESSYWLTYFPLRAFLSVFDLAQLVNVVWLGIKTRLFGRTPRDIREWTQPPIFQFAVYYSNFLFLCAVALVYAPLAPLVPLAAAVVFWVSSFVYKYQLMFVQVPKVESGGTLWNTVMNRVLFSLVLMHLLMTLTVGLQMGWKSWFWIAALPPIIITGLFKVIFIRPMVNQFRFWVPTPEEIAASKVHSERGDSGGRLEKRFGHPALHSDLFTPMLHAKMMPLLSQVYHGRLGREKKGLAEYSGQKMETAIAPGGVRIAGIAESDLEADLAQYQRDRGTMDGETQSLASTTILGDSSVGHGLRQGLHEEYLKHGPKTPEAFPLLPVGQGFSGSGHGQRFYQGSNISQSRESLSGLNAPQYSDARSTHSGVSGPPVYNADSWTAERARAPPYPPHHGGSRQWSTDNFGR